MLFLFILNFQLTMASLIAFKKDHAHSMVQGIMNSSYTQVDKSLRPMLDGLEVQDMSFTAIDNNKDIICSGGIIPLWEGVYEGWVMASQLSFKHPITSAKVIKQGLHFLVDKFDVVRLQTAVKKDFATGKKFAEWLGMTLEGEMPKYQNEQDYLRYARIYK
jgi:hypothetical protein